MPLFCTRCGTRNDEGSSFCENCGAPLRNPPLRNGVQVGAGAAPAAAAPLADPLGAAARPRSRDLLVVGAVVAAVLAVGGGGLAVWLQPPAPTPDRLLAAARSDLTAQELEPLKRQLCIGNADYRGNAFNANPYDQGTVSWMNTLVAAGLYSAPVPVPGSMFSGNLLQYVPTPELVKHRDGSRLCVARGLEIAAIGDVGQPLERSSADRLVRAQMVVRATGLAPWMAQQPVRERVLSELSGWEWQDGSLQQRVPLAFALQGRAWKTGRAAQDQARSAPATQRTASADPEAPSLLARLSSLLHLGGNPLEGTWRMEVGNFMGVRMPAGLAPNLTFTADALDAGGARVPVKYEVQGKRVTVTADGDSQRMVFLLEGDDSILFETAGLRYTRVR